MKKTAIITGITGQDGAYLAQLLLQNNYEVIGIVRSYTSSNFNGLDYLKIRDNITLVECDLLDISHIINVIKDFKPDEIYNLAAQSSVSLSFAQPIGTFTFNTLSVFNILEAIKLVNSNIKFYQASSSEMYGGAKQLPIHETTEINPLSPYAISKAAAHWTCNNYRDSYGLFICCGILFNHESVLRSKNFFIKKVVTDCLKIKAGTLDKIEVGNINISRDFGLAKSYVETMYLMMQQPVADNYVICSGKSTTLKHIIDIVFDVLDIPSSCLYINNKLFRPSEIDDIYGTAEKAKRILGWKYDYDIHDLMRILIDEEIDRTSIINNI